MKRACLVAIVVAFALCLPAIAEADDAKADQAASAAEPANGDSAAAASLEQLTERVRKSVATITSASRDGTRDGLGTGFVIAADGLIATNYHVVGDGRAVGVQLGDGRRLDVTAVHASDRQVDLAILRVDAKDLTALELANSELAKQGQSVVAFGNPQGLKNSVVAGIVSGVREIDGRSMIQLAMPIEPGNSGGPLVDVQGRVLGVLTMKSLVTPNLGFALAINSLKPLFARPNPIPMSRWLTIGALDAREWQPLFGARWRQRAGRIAVDGAGNGFGGRSLCVWQGELPEAPFEVAVTVRLDDESGAAGLAFGSDGGNRHFGFYPTNGHLRLTRFDGPDVQTWAVLYDQASRHYVAGGWNTLRARLAEGKVTCFVNDEQVVEMADGTLRGGKVGLVKFRDTRAWFKGFQFGRQLPPAAVPPEEIARITRLVEKLPERGPLDAQLVESLAADAPLAARVLASRAASLDRQARQLRALAQAAHEHRTIAELARALSGPEDRIDLVCAGLLVARLDNDEVDVQAYCQDVKRMAREVSDKLPADVTDQAKLDALRKFMFEENGFHGSRGDYYNRANSYLNEVLDDREGLPITLSVVYMELARRIGLMIEGVGLPGHFVVRYVPAAGEPQLIDVFDGATPVARDEAARRVKEASERELTDDDLRPATKRTIITRMLQNLLEISSSDPAALDRYLSAILAIQPESAQHRWLRAIVRYRLEDRPGAAVDIDWLVENQPSGIDMTPVLEMQRALRQQPEQR